MDVLKDAAATALYGTRAANGVIVVTTKKGRAGRPVISYNFTGTVRHRPRYSDRKIDLMNAKERTQVSRDLAAMHYTFPSNMTYIAMKMPCRSITGAPITGANSRQLWPQPRCKIRIGSSF
nr:hypothetical protein [Segatella maculosa]